MGGCYYEVRTMALCVCVWSREGGGGQRVTQVCIMIVL